MREKIENRLKINCDSVDLTTLTHVEFYVRQPHLFCEYVPEIVSAHEMMVIIPFEDARKLRSNKPVELQFAFLYENGKPDASEIYTMDVKRLLKEVGYDKD